eukprot:SAG31_NODE_5191_length_2689_cov_3.062934_2_plen_177_part_00
MTPDPSVRLPLQHHSIKTLMSDHTACAADALINSAGGTAGNPTNLEPGFEPIEKLTNSKFTRLFEINVLGVVNTTKAVTPSMKAAGCGKIVNITSGAGLQPSLTGIQGYTAAKHAEVGLTKQLALELGPFGINVNSVAPGFFRYHRPSLLRTSECNFAAKLNLLFRGLGRKLKPEQ